MCLPLPEEYIVSPGGLVSDGGGEGAECGVPEALEGRDGAQVLVDQLQVLKNNYVNSGFCRTGGGFRKLRTCPQLLGFFFFTFPNPEP